MPQDLPPVEFGLSDIDDWVAGDGRELQFTVVDESGTGIDISGATVSWSLFEREYNSETADAVIDDSDNSVTVVTGGSPPDPTAGEFHVDIDGDATTDLWGDFYQRPVVEESDGTVSTWIGEITLTA